MARRLAPASRWGLGSRSEPGLWLAPGLWSESGLLPERRLEPEWMRTSGPGPRLDGCGAGMDADVGAWAAAVGDELVSGPEQANRVVRATKSAQYSSFDMAVVLLLRLGSFPSVG